jgi:hypothetical protein
MVDLLEQVKTFVRPELLILVPVMYFVGMGLKKWRRFKDNDIPVVLGLVGAALAAMWVVPMSDVATWQSGVLAAFTAITQGVLCAGLSVFINQLWKQSKKEE